MNNYDGDDETPFQGGDFSFHYTITSGPRFEPVGLSRFAREEVNPFETDPVTYADKLVWRAEPLDAESGGFVQIDRPEVELMTWKGAEDGRGSILRFYNTGETSVSARATFPHLRFKEAYWSSGTENDIGAAGNGSGALILSLKPHEIRTVRIMGISAQPKE
jgi:alpha-mannosidase